MTAELRAPGKPIRAEGLACLLEPRAMPAVHFAPSLTAGMGPRLHWERQEAAGRPLQRRTIASAGHALHAPPLVNLVLFEAEELSRPLSHADRRAEHIINVLKRGVGDTFDAGVVNGARGRATVTRIGPRDLEFIFDAMNPVSAPPAVTLIVGLPRPQTARDILRDATTLGVAAIHFVATEKSERSYAQSTLWTSGEWRRQVLAGAEQAFDTRIPVVKFGQTLKETLAELPTDAGQPGLSIALDNYEATSALADIAVPPNAVVTLALGSERGWSGTERDLLRANGFTLAHLGSRVLRTETAVVAGLATIAALRRR